MITNAEKRRYAAQIRLPEIAAEGQQRLKESGVLIVGCGALGSVIAMYLAGAGVGHIAIADFDTVEVSNLHRQPFYSEQDAGKSKVSLLAERMKALNPDIDVLPVSSLMDSRRLSSMLENGHGYDMVVDAADNPATTYMIEDCCAKASVPYSTAGVAGWKGQVLTCLPGSVKFSDLFPNPGNEAASVLPCSVSGISGPLPAMIAAIQAAEVIKCLAAVDSLLTDRLLTVDLLECRFEVIPL